ncbi:MAG: shikimate dehydrogenase, partial [Xanthomonadales bacterium]|nr:shikimate dehydrogenase [Xanthomonadales bacterium]
LALDELADCGVVDIVIDATSMGHSGAQPRIPVEVLAEAELCYSMNYGRAAGPLRALAIRAGVPFHDGLGMLVEQAACAFEIWFDRKPDTGPVLDALRRASG